VFIQGKAIRQELLVQEYVSLRNESLAAKQNQQSVLQWSLGAVGVIAAATAALLAATPDIAKMHVAVIVAAAAMYGLVIPVLIASAFGVWVGEVKRMERAGRFIHARELAANAHMTANTDAQDRPGEFTIMWETLISDPGYRSTYGKNRIGATASCILFGCIYLGGLVSSAVIVLKSDRVEGYLSSPVVIAWIVGLVFLAGAFVLVFGRILLPMRRNASSGSS